MIKIIEKVLNDLADMQLNLKSEVARTWIAQKVEQALTEQESQRDEMLKRVNESLVRTHPTFAIDDVINDAMKVAGYEQEASGYDMRNGTRDITFVGGNDKYEVTFRKLEEE